MDSQHQTPGRPEHQDNASDLVNNPEETDIEIEDEEDEDEEKGTVVEHLQKMPLKARYRALGKIFTLKFWPWPAPVWWVIDASQTGKASDLDVKIHRQFTLFVEIEMVMFADEWMSPEFIREVFFFTL